MEVYFKPVFIRDYKKLPGNYKKKVKKICMKKLKNANSLKELAGYSIKKIKGFNNFFRIRVKDMRIGFKKKNKKLIFMRVLNRKDIYKKFP